MHGGPFDECPDGKRDWFPQRRVCWPAAELAVAERTFDHLHKDAPWHDGSFQVWRKEFSPETPWHYKDGTTLYLSEVDENPDDHFLTDKLASPLGSVAEQAPGDEG